MGCFREILLVEINFLWTDATPTSSQIFHFYLPSLDFSNLDRNVASGFQDPKHFSYGQAYVFSPLGNGRGEFWYFVGINARKPAAKPVVLPVVQNIQEWRRGHY
jgi:hypothetical protein